jgi:hypothetical protein
MKLQNNRERNWYESAWFYSFGISLELGVWLCNRKGWKIIDNPSVNNMYLIWNERSVQERVEKLWKTTWSTLTMHLLTILCCPANVWKWETPINFHIWHRLPTWHRLTFVFRFSKQKLREITLIDEEDLISRVLAIFNKISDSVLILVLKIWIK